MKEQIKSFIIGTFMYDGESLKDDEPLFESGIIDSLGFVRLLKFIEDTFGISINMVDVTIEKFNTINDIEKTIRDKMNE